MKKKPALIAFAFLAIFALLQMTNPARTNPPIKSDLIATLHPPTPVSELLVHACYDCHSHQTRWPWYSRIAPVSWLVVSDVIDGRKNLNLSEWPDSDVKRAVRKLDGMSEQIGNGVMPPTKYTLIHADARLTDSQRKILTDWLDAQADKLGSPAQ